MVSSSCIGYLPCNVGRKSLDKSKPSSQSLSKRTKATRQKLSETNPKLLLFWNCWYLYEQRIKKSLLFQDDSSSDLLDDSFSSSTKKQNPSSKESWIPRSQHGSLLPLVFGLPFAPELQRQSPMWTQVRSMQFHMWPRVLNKQFASFFRSSQPGTRSDTPPVNWDPWPRERWLCGQILLRLGMYKYACQAANPFAILNWNCKTDKAFPRPSL